MRTEDGFHLAAGWLDDAVAATGAMAEGVRGLDLGHPVRVAASALPGSGTANAAASVIATWMGHVLGVAEDLVAHADALAASAETYRLADAAAVDTFLAAPGEVGRS